jgi:hypothetical protein
MTSKLKMIGLAGLLSFGLAGVLSASVMLTPTGSTNIFLAGQTTGAGCATTGPGCAPSLSTNAELDFLPVAGNVMTFQGPGIALGSAVTGSTSPCPSCGTAGPDGANLGSASPATSINGGAGNNLSPIQYTGDEMFLIGVFLGASLPASPVASIGDYGAGGSLSASNATYSPLLGQTFFVGDGLTPGNVIQQFVVPTGATRVFFGFADAMSFVGAAGMFGDNSGSLNVNVQIEPTSSGTAPEPGTLTLFALGFAGLLLGRKKSAA